MPDDRPYALDGLAAGNGILTPRWNVYSELRMAYLLALGSRTHPIPADSWDVRKRPVVGFDGQ
jgi:hypothetical protein